ncbi:MAG: hypothetical protein OEV73_01335 [Desulfobulbaceae bacterium]|nr:hypothetical protein [Desulfobulbaceae bacterium]
MTPSMSTRKSTLHTALFLIVCGGIFLFLWNAPPETTVRLPQDADHAKYYPMDKKEAEKECQNCHNPEGAALPKDHPPKYRCLFCHKKMEQEGQ